MDCDQRIAQGLDAMASGSCTHMHTHAHACTHMHSCTVVNLPPDAARNEGKFACQH